MNITVRKANRQDIGAVDKAYTELLLHEREHGAYTVWQLGYILHGKLRKRALRTIVCMWR